MNRLQADILLFFTAIIWGTAFIAQKIGNESMGPITFVGLRFLLSALMVLPLAVWEFRKSTAPLARRNIVILIAIGLCLFVGNCLQQVAMVTASATHGGFLTALYVVLVPFTTWILTRERIRPLVLVACLVSITGAYLLTYRGDDGAWHSGDILLVGSDFFWALWITLIGMFMKSGKRPYFLAFTQFAITFALATPLGFALEPNTLKGIQTALPALLFTGLISGGLAFTLQIFAQRHTPPAEAALIMSLESVFASIAGAILLGERLTTLALTGCALILAGVIVAEVLPAALRKQKL